MNRITNKKVIFGTKERPRASVFRSNRRISAQLIDDEVGKTLLAITSKSIKEKKKPIELAFMVGQELAKKSKSQKIKAIVFDRGRFRYHGQVKALAEGIRAGGITF